MREKQFSRAASITPSDTVGYDPADAIYVGGAGNVSVQLVGQSAAQVFAGVPAGTVLHVRTNRVNVTNTAGSNYVALYFD